MFVVAGVTGHVGSVVAQELLAKKKPVRVLVRSADKGAAWAKQGAEVAVVELEDEVALARALGGAAGFFVLLPPNYQAQDFFATQRKTAESIAAAVHASGVPHVVMLSSIGAELPSGTGPIRGLHVLEEALRSTGTLLTAIRASSFQENVGMSIAPAKQQGIFASFAASLDFAMPLIATRDIGRLAAQLLVDKPAKSEVIDLLGPLYSNKQVAEKLGNALGKKLQIVEVPAVGAVDAMVKGGMPKPLAELFAEMYAAGNAGHLVPKGDRQVQGTTTLDDTLPHLVGS
jgi:uncharacterized protein YbjT (DUF2867 family)